MGERPNLLALKNVIFSLFCAFLIRYMKKKFTFARFNYRSDHTRTFAARRSSGTCKRGALRCEIVGKAEVHDLPTRWQLVRNICSSWSDTISTEVVSVVWRTGSAGACRSNFIGGTCGCVAR